MMTVSMLLKSCAMPPVSCPTASIFCACTRVAFGFDPPPHFVLKFGGAKIELPNVVVAHLGEEQQQPNGERQGTDDRRYQHRPQSAGVADSLGQQVAFDLIESGDQAPRFVHQRFSRTRPDQIDGFGPLTFRGKRQHLPVDLAELLGDLCNLLQAHALRRIVGGHCPQLVERDHDLRCGGAIGLQKGVAIRQQIAANAGFGIERGLQELAGQLPDFDRLLHPALCLGSAKRQGHCRQARNAHQRDGAGKQAQAGRRETDILEMPEGLAARKGHPEGRLFRSPYAPAPRLTPVRVPWPPPLADRPTISIRDFACHRRQAKLDPPRAGKQRHGTRPAARPCQEHRMSKVPRLPSSGFAR